MSFTTVVKEEILSIKQPRVSSRAFLSALTHTCGSIGLDNGKLGFEISCETKAIVIRAAKLIKELYKVELEVFAYSNLSVNKKTIYAIKLYDDRATAILENLRIIDLSEGLEVIFGIDEGLFENDYDEKAYVTAAFLGCGFLTLPSENSKMGYHLEFGFNNGIMADDFASLLLRCGFNPKFINRKDKCLIYIKDSESIADMLAFMESMNGVLRLSEVIVERETRNLINRQTNCEMANIDRAIKASQKQIDCIKFIKEKGMFDSLPDVLKEFAIIREANPEVSLEELGTMFEKPLSKSGVNYRMRKLMKIAKELE
ncbi:MAG: DNA-binding protein WhiA [Clostridia bacterium]|nr:DNA-binding protein WhiA [Clostridia bacterium]